MFTPDLIYWLSVSSACLLAAMSPGPSIAVVINYTLSGGRWAGISCALGHGVAIAIYAFVSAFGLLIIFDKSIVIFNIIQLVGIVVLLILGIKLLTSQAQFISTSNKVISGSHWRAARDGFLIAFVNPKVLVFFTALFSQFLHEDMYVSEKISLGLVAAIIDMLWYSLVTVLIVHTSAVVRLQQQAWMLDRLFGCLLIVFCIYFSKAILF